jgi:AcrR family transcriptional regulator
MSQPEAGSTRRRLSPEARREHILETARALFAERPFESLSAADVAEAAGVARSLVHHYFGSMRELYMAIVAEAAKGFTDVREAGVDVPFARRTALDVDATLDWIGANREAWLAIVVRNSEPADPQLRALFEATVERSIERALALNFDLIADVPLTRLALRGFHAFGREVTSAWVRGEVSRAQAHALLVTSLRDLLLQTLPALEVEARPPA